MSKWAFSIMVTKYLAPSHIHHRHGAGVVSAASRDEAIGKVMRIARKVYPSSDGWRDHDVVVQSADVIVDPETVVLIPCD